LETTVPDDGPPDETAAPASQVATISTEFGVTVIGDPVEVDAYLKQYAIDTSGMRMSIPPAKLQQAFGSGGLLARLGANSVAKYMSSNLGPAQYAELRMVTRDPVSKRFTSTRSYRPLLSP